MSDGGNRTITIVDDVVSERAPRPGVMVVSRAGRPESFVHFFDGKPLRFGRTSAIAIDDPGMSGDHATIEFRGDEGFRFIDRGSKNGSFLNGHFMRSQIELAEGPSATVRMGTTVLLLLADAGHYDMRFIATKADEVIGAITSRIYEALGKAARANVNTLILGETGTGKLHAARAFHEGSGRRGRMLSMNCATVVGTLAEAQLFGAKRGVASGVEAQTGLFRAAEGGTVFLDEIGELALPHQAKLLDVVQTKLVTPLGSTTPEKVDFRLVCATHRDLEKMVAEGTFREDLYMRIAELTVTLPPLRDRREEIPHLVALSLANTGLRPTAQVLETLMLQQWPGNVRDLMRALTEAKLAAEGQDVLTQSHLPDWARVGVAVPKAVEEEAPRSLPPTEEEEDARPDKKAQRAEVRRLYRLHGSSKKAADLAGVKRSTAHRWLKQDGLLGDDED